MKQKLDGELGNYQNYKVLHFYHDAREWCRILHFFHSKPLDVSVLGNKWP